MTTTLATFVAIVGVDSKGVTPAGFTSHGRSKVRIAIVFAVGFDIDGRRLKGRYQIHGRTSENVKSIAFWGSGRDYEIHGTTSNNRTAIFGTSSPACTLDDGCEDSNVGSWRNNAAITFSTIATVVTTASVNSDEVVPVNFDRCRVTPYRWTTTLATAAGANLDEVTQLNFTSYGVAPRCWTTVRIVTVSTVTFDMIARDSEGSRQRWATGIGGR